MATTNQKSLVESVPKGLLIGGRWRDSSDGATLTVEDPSDGSTLAQVADATVDDGKAAVADLSFDVQGFWTAVGGALVVSIAASVLHRLLEPDD